ncbi:peptidase [Marinilabiliaceae bacterium JC040]|nr:peptidase [Marinilabiliaceae bacterium JC040]
MKKIIILLSVVLISIATFFYIKEPNKSNIDLFSELKDIPGVVSVKKMEVKPYKNYYEIYFKQAIDHNDLSKGFFKQRVLLGHIDLNKPMIVEIQGYNIWTSRQGELSRLLNANQLTIEHRFFKDSKPKGGLIPWKDLTIKNAAYDQHVIIQAIKKIYSKSKWITTGISKGGQTTIIHRYYYPNDVDASVPYVAPLNLSRVDPRIQKFLDTVGSKEERKAIYDFQILCFENISKMLPMMKEYCKKNNYSFNDVGSNKRALELSILEYPFAYWQWGNVKMNDIPKDKKDIKAIFMHLVKNGDPGFFEDSKIEFQRPYFWAAMIEMGIYDYKIAPFKKYLKDEKDICFEHTLPKGFENVKFDGSEMKKIYNWIQTDAEKMLFIVGGLDTWGSTSVVLNGNNKCAKYVLANGHHGTRISSFNEKDRKEIMKKINEWIK